MKISEKIKKLREGKGWSQNQFAEKISMHPQHVSRYERGISSPSSEALAKIADAFGVSTDYLLSETENKKEYSFKDKQLLKYFEEVDKLNEEDRNLIKGLIASVLAKNKVNTNSQ
jgi:transcriptional regulator with XRE-family HTH domain